MKGVVCSVILLLITILLLTKSHPLKAIVFVLFVEICSTYLEVIVSSLCIEICRAPSESATTTWSSASKSVVMSLFLEILIPFISPSVNSVIIWYGIYSLNKVGERDSLVELHY